MLCDDFLEWSQRSAAAAMTDRAGQLGQTIVDRLKRAQRFVLSPTVLETVSELADPAAIEKTRDHLFTPSETTWIECAGAIPGVRGASSRHGFLLDGERVDGKGSIHVGVCAYASDTWLPNGQRGVIPMMMTYDMPATGRSILKLESRMVPPGIAMPDFNMRKLSAWLGACLALLNTPRISDMREHDAAKLNMSRLKRGMPPVLSYSIVTINVDSGEMGVGGQGVAGLGRSLHHVRSHLRIKRGRVELVRPHWRGDPHVGVRISRHVVRRDEDERGTWMGEPPPAARIIRELWDDEQ